MSSKKRDSFFSDTASNSEENFDEKTIQDTKGWNVFREIPLKQETGSMVKREWVDISVKLLKVLTYFVTFALVLGFGVAAKGSLLFMTSQLKKDRQIMHCNRLLGLGKQFVTYLSVEERVAWLWCVICVFSATEVGKFLRSARICFFKRTLKPTTGQLLLVLAVETLQTIGYAMLVLFILPEMDVIKGVMLTNCMCLIPAVLTLLSRAPTDPKYTSKLLLDILAISCQLTGFVVWPLLTGVTALWLIPVACTCISAGWWENYVDKESEFKTIRALARLRESLKKSRYDTYQKVTLCNIATFLVCSILYFQFNGDSPWALFTSAGYAFNFRTYLAQEVQVTIEDLNSGTTNTSITGETFELSNQPLTPVWVMLIQVVSAYLCYSIGKFACRILIQPFSFSLPLNLVVPVTVNLLILFCGLRNADPCYFQNVIPDYLFFEIPPVYYLNDFVAKDVTWIWLLWLTSQMWITVHIWSPKFERLASSDKLFALPLYSGIVIDQSLILNRTKDEDMDIKVQDLMKSEEEKPPIDDYYDNFSLNTDNTDFVPSDVRSSDHLARIFICATMWHETKDEMIEFLKSIFRLDEDQCARRVAQKYLQVVDPDYYELETHIFFDDAFEVSDHNMEDFQINRFVRLLIDTVDEAASHVHLTKMSIRPPKKYPTPYGGRLVWTLPGKTKMICHLKDKSKIRHKKRWSQVMYMYYFLGHRLMDLPISVERKEVISEHTYLLALDGDVDFQPKAVLLLIDLMRKNRNLGAACGRIHPMGTGPMVWYQMFEYAIGHWMQKATEHVIGCVLCSPGCFSLFRGKALMDDNVMRKYTLMSHEARHYVQYDQGEDRWLCTLLLQRGYRVEYSAASDAYTHCPEGFNEFFNQRRRWVPSTMANILDLLSDSERTIKVNDSISRLYISYQILLMVGTILGPGTIFLMMVGAINTAFGVSYMIAFYINFVPVAIFLAICLTCESKIQLFFAGAITCFYGLIMVAVMLGIALQIVEDGWLAPSSMFTVATLGSFVLTAALHPQEMNCLFYLLVYYITIPSMYMLLIIYSLCNLNNVTWGTREVAQKKTFKQLEMEAELAKKAPATKAGFFSTWMNKLPSADEKGSIEFSLAGLFKIICCVQPTDNKDSMQMMQLAHTLERIERKIDTSNGISPAEPVSQRRRSSINLRSDARLSILNEYEESDGSESDAVAVQEERDDLSNPFWIEDPGLRKGEVDFLSTAEITFWKDLIDAYLRPIEENKDEQNRIKTDLKNLRNRSVFAFIMINTIFVLIILILQINQDQLHIVWPWGAEVSITYDQSENTIELNREFLRLEPIGMVFVVFFAAVLFIQFLAMLVHRFGTFTHLLATVHLNWYFSRKTDDFNEKGILERHAIDIVRDLQKLKVEDEDDDVNVDAKDQVSRRRTIHNLQKSRETKANVGNLDEAFKKRFFNLSVEDTAKISIGGGVRKQSLRRETLRVLESRRNSFIAERRKTQMQRRNSKGVLFPGTGLYESNRSRASQSNKYRDSVSGSGGGFTNRAYEPAFDDEDDELATPRAKRKSYVAFA